MERKDASVAAEALRTQAEAVRDCRKCELCDGRGQVVFGVGSPVADLMFVGEGPGYHEDRLGEPFVGQAGKLLTELLAGIGLTRADVYIANVVKCRPPGNRDPLPAEIEACTPHLKDQVAVIRPRVICTLGRFATRLLADTELSISSIHGKAKDVTIAGVDTTIFPVFHPAAALYTPANRKVLEEDFAKLRRLLSAEPDAGPSEGQTAEQPAVAKSEPAALHQPPLAGRRTDSGGGEQLPLW